MRYSAVVDSETLEIIDSRTQEATDAIAIIPSYMPDLELMIQRVPKEIAGELARLAAWRAAGFIGIPDEGFEV